VTLDRFAYGTNLARATSYREHSHASWPPAYDYHLSYLDLANEVPALGAGLHVELETLRVANRSGVGTMPRRERQRGRGHAGRGCDRAILAPDRRAGAGEADRARSAEI